MKTFIFLCSLLVVGAAQAAETTYRCECFQNIPFEAYQIYVVETSNSEESWMLLDERPSQYDDALTCAAAIAEEKICADLLKM